LVEEILLAYPAGKPAQHTLAPLFIIVYQCFSIQGYGQGTSLEYSILGWCTTITPRLECGETRSRSGDDTGLDSLL